MNIFFKIDKLDKYISEDYPNTNMENRIDRKDDESLYQPKIHSERIRTLYQLKQAMGKPMTELLDQAVSDLAGRWIRRMGDLCVSELTTLAGPP